MKIPKSRNYKNLYELRERYQKKEILASYDIYVREYLIKEEKMSKQGLKMAKPLKSSADFYSKYRSIVLDQIDEMMIGERASISNITRQIVNEGAYGAKTHRYARNIQKFLQRSGENEKYKYSYYQIRKGEIDWGLVKAYRKELEKQGKTKKEIAKEIAQTFFESPK